VTAIVLTVSDPDGSKATRRFKLTVTPVNDAPTLAPIDAQTTDADAAKEITLEVDDVDDDPADLAVAALATRNAGLLTALPVTGAGKTRKLTLTPAAGQSGTADVEVTVTDPDDADAKRTFVLTVNTAATPLSASRQTTTPASQKPTRILSPWKLVRRSAPAVKGRRGVLRAQTGYVAQCPAGGPACTGLVTLKVIRRSPTTGRLVPIFLTGKKAPAITIAPGAERALAFVLSPRAAALLREVGAFSATLRGVFATGAAKPVIQKAEVRLTVPK
jgi:hypothetical protein